MDYIVQNKETYDKVAVEYNTKLRQPRHRLWTDAQWSEFFSQYVKKHHSVLELGPGSGRILNILASLCIDTTAVELSPEMAKHAKANSPGSKIIVDDIKNVNFAKELFDLILSNESLHCFPTYDQNIVLSKFYDWTKRDGHIIVSTNLHDKHDESFSNKGNYKDTPSRFKTRFTLRSLESVLYKNGFKIKDQITESANGKSFTIAVCRKRNLNIPIIGLKGCTNESMLVR